MGFKKLMWTLIWYIKVQGSFLYSYQLLNKCYHLPGVWGWKNSDVWLDLGK